jgi:hypothetical protein
VTPTLSILTLAGVLAYAGATLVLWIIYRAFTDSLAQGLLALFVPGYVIYYGWTRFSEARRRPIVVSALAAFLVAGIAWGISTRFGPHASMIEAAAARDMWGGDHASARS